MAIRSPEQEEVSELMRNGHSMAEAWDIVKGRDEDDDSDLDESDDDEPEAEEENPESAWSDEDEQTDDDDGPDTLEAIKDAFARIATPEVLTDGAVALGTALGTFAVPSFVPGFGDGFRRLGLAAAVGAGSVALAGALAPDSPEIAEAAAVGAFVGLGMQAAMMYVAPSPALAAPGASAGGTLAGFLTLRKKDAASSPRDSQ